MTKRAVVLLLLWASSSVLSVVVQRAGASSVLEAAPTAGPGTLANREEVPRRLVRAGPRIAVPGAGGEVRARGFVAELLPQLSLSAGDELVLTRRANARAAEHFLFEQLHRGLPVLGSYLAVHVDRSGAVRLAINETTPRLDADVTPRLSREDALQAARKRVGVAGERYHADPTAVLAVTRARALVWRVMLPCDEPFGDWDVLVDAIDGTVLSVEDRVVSFIDGEGTIFDPNPVVRLQTQSLADMDDSPAAIPAGAYVPVTLRGLNAPLGGLYYLRGENCSIEDFEAPMTARAVSADPNAFTYDRGNDRFEEVNVYFHIDAAVRQLRALGFDGILTHPIACDAHGLNGSDNSHYVPSTGRLAYGDGCVDDGEDAEVIWHEFGHAVQDNQVPGWVNTGESGAMGEGFSDFLAASFSEPVSNGYGVEQLFDWDRGPVDGCWNGRRIDSAKHYPEDMTGEVHADGEIWSAVLWELAQGLGRDRAVTLIIESHWMVPLGGSFEDGAVALLLTDELLYGGVDIPLLLDRFEARGIIDLANYAPAIEHAAPSSTDDPIGPYVVTVQVDHFAPIPPDSVHVLFRTSPGAFIAASMPPTGAGDEYGFSLQGVPVGTTYEYYFRATDFAGLTTRLPAAEGMTFSFSVTSDASAPVITHTPLQDAPYGTWPPQLGATVTDSHGVDSLAVTVLVDGVEAGTFHVPRIEGTDTYAVDFPVGTATIDPGTLIQYRLTAVDRSEAHNRSYAPGAGQYYSFEVLNAAGRALVVDDDNLGTGAPLLATDLQAAGFLVTTTVPGSLSSSMLPGYDFVAWAASNNAQPLNNAGARAMIEEYVAGGGKFMIEGGEVGFDAITMYQSFAFNVLHIDAYGTHSGGTGLRPLPWKRTHPVLYQPNVLPEIIPFTWGGNAANQDVVRQRPEATLVIENVGQLGGTYGYWGPGYTGLLVYDDNDAPQSGQVVYGAFSLAQVSTTNPTIRRQLVSNIGHYLVARESEIRGSISGSVRLVGGPLDQSGTVVRSLTDDQITFTDADGSYTLPGLYSAPQLLEFMHAGYEAVQLAGPVPPENGMLPGNDIELRPVDTFSAFTMPLAPIPDINTTGVSSSVQCALSGTLHDISVGVVIHHSYIGDLIVELRAPSGRTLRLHNRTGKGDDNIITTFDSERVPDGPGSFADFTGEPVAGTWTLKVTDNRAVETGTFDSWTLTLTALRPTTGSPDPEAPPAFPRLDAPAPNPAASSVELSYAVPRDGRVRLAVYDLLGREVAVLFEGRRTAGRHAAIWDGRDASGRRAGAGVYFCRLSAAGTEETRKLVLLD